jgi:DNA repair exonuclease SbcCD ATPase subunit
MFETKLKDMQNDIQIKKNELSALARELTNKTNLVNFYKNELEQKRKKLDQAKADFNNKKVDLNSNQNVFKTAKQAEEEVSLFFSLWFFFNFFYFLIKSKNSGE